MMLIRVNENLIHEGLSLSEHTDWLHTGSSFIGHTVGWVGKYVTAVS